MTRVLVIEDQKKLLRSLEQGLAEEGYETLCASTGEEGYQLGTSEQVDAVILDLMLPGRDGLQLLKDLRDQGFKKPILILTARDTVDDRVRGLDSGADDYLIKPFAFAELVARLRALLRREASGPELVLRAGSMELDLVSRRAIRGGQGIDLRKREFELLEYLMRNKNSTVTREMIARDVWKETSGILTNVIDVYINLLRKKIEVPGQPALIQTVRGVGYALRDAE
jgi:two-component system copper resistance phosphate regulon response regulator CusR